MSATFHSIPGEDGVSITACRRRLLSKELIPPGEWLALEGRQGLAASIVMGLVECGEAWVEAGNLILSHSAAAGLPSSVADTLGMPALVPLSLSLSFDGRIEQTSSRIRVRWQDANTRPLNAVRTGAFVTFGREKGRLSAPLYGLLRTIDRFNDTEGGDRDARIAAWQPVQSALQSLRGEPVSADDYLKSLTIYQAGSFALDVRETQQGIDFKPVLMSRSKAPSLEDNAPAAEGESGEAAISEMRDEVRDALLPPELQNRFAEDFFQRPGTTRDAYVLGRNRFLLVDRDLKAALDVVRRKRFAPDEERRAFVKNPRPAIIEAIAREDAADTAVSLFVETGQYSDRVLGLGLWNPLKEGPRTSGSEWVPPGEFTLRLGDKSILLKGEEIESIRQAVMHAKAAAQPEVTVNGERYPVEKIEEALAGLPPGLHEASEPFSGPAGPLETDRQVLTVKENFEEKNYAAAPRARQVLIPRDLPQAQLAPGAAPKTHQREGFDWLLEAWASRLPGVLLADDMGLGKTFQALAFLAWIRRNQNSPRGKDAAGQRGPILIVAPTALLNNWIAEAKRHLAPGVLGERADVFGAAIRRLKRPKTENWTPEDSLDIDRLQKAGWILTTYETLADNHRAFARIAYPVAVFDEMQKVKSPGTLNTNAAKTINADFVLGLTGTPIENQIEDLWCIMDRVTPGTLGSRKEFSAAYGSANHQKLKELKHRLDRPQNGAPALMLRRMKEAILDGLPQRKVKTYRVEMPDPQAKKYTEAVRAARSGKRTRSAMLKALHDLRAISLHPDACEDDWYDPEAANRWVSRSARLKQTIAVLHEIEGQQEKALVFMEDRAFQRLFAAAATVLFRLRAGPAVINGEVPGAKRQEIVDKLQASPPGFGLLVLSPRAAGIGLTLTAANHVIHLSRWWNPAVEDQCNDRVHRIGQEKPVTIHLPMAIHPNFGEASFDITLEKLLAQRRELSRHMLTPPILEADVGTLFGGTVGPEQGGGAASSEAASNGGARAACRMSAAADNAKVP